MPSSYAVETTVLARRFGSVQALDGVSLAIQKGEFFSLLGPSGCGKTTLLRLIAGLDTPEAGTLKIGGVDMTHVPAHRRPVNTVFQSYALFPHLNVRDNVAFGLRMKGVPHRQLTERVARTLALVRLSELADRRPAQLSGGEKQRAALARALVNEPDVLLLDEPLGALDLKLRKQLQVELRQLQRRLGITFIHVTHDQDEALGTSDRIAVLNAGRVEQVGGARELYERPRTRFVAQFVGACTLLDATVVRVNAGEILAQTKLGELRVAAARSQGGALDAPPDQITLAIRPEKVRLLTPGEPMSANCVPAEIMDVIYAGSETQYRLRAQELMLTAVALNDHAGQPSRHIGQTLLCRLPEEALIILDE